jgi:hypothetical protein
MINLNWKQKAVVGVASLLIIISFLIPPCYIDYGDKNVPMGYVPFGLFKIEFTSSGVQNPIFLHTPTFYAQLVVIALITMGLILIFGDSKAKY